MSNALIVLYQQMADLTKPKCGQCRLPHSCCDEMYCRFAIQTAKERGVVLETTSHPTLPLMGPEGCTCPPHHRQLCSLHVCSISSHGSDARDMIFTKKYFQLRRKIDREELKEYEKEKHVQDSVELE